MGVYSGPEITSDGLVLALDAGNTKGFDDDENLMTNSQLGNTILNDGGGVTLTTDTTIVNPFGVYDGVLKCVHTTNTPGYFRRGQNMSLTAGVTYTFSFFFKNGTVVSPYGQNRLNIGLLASTYSPTFDETGQGLNQNNPVGDGWYRQVFTFTPSYTQTYQVDFNQTVNQTPLGTYYLYGFQLERGSSASPYYATTASAKTRGTTLIDMSGRGNSGTLTNGPTYSSANGGSIVFDGTNDYALVTNPTTIQNQNFTISTWVNPGVQNAGLISMIDFDHGGGNGWVLQSEDATTNRYYYFAWWNGSGFEPTGGGGYGAGKGIQLTTSVWQNIVYSKSGTSLLGYMNGNQVYTGTAGSSNVGYGSNKNLGIGDWILTGRAFKGNISNTQIYNRALSAAEIQQNFNATKSRYGL